MQSCPKCRSACTPDSNRCPSCGARIQRDLDAPRAPTVGAYRLGTLLLECTAGKTYQAEDTRRPERALVKILRHEHGLDEQALARYFAQVRAVNALKHPHIARILDYGEHADGEKYVILEPLTGTDVFTAMRLEKVLPLELSVRIALQLALALDALHGIHVYHLNLRPQSLYLVERNGRQDFLKLLDVGDAMLACAATPGYISPEQAADQPADHRADIYSLGVILYEMVTGRRPFEADSMKDYLYKHITAEPPRPTEMPDLPHRIPDALEELILVCLEKNPAMRPLSMKEVERSLRILAGGPEATDDTAQIRFERGRDRETMRPRPPTRRNRAWVGLVAVGLLAGAVAAWFGLRVDHGPPAAAAADGRGEAADEPPAPEVVALPAAKTEIRFESRPPGAEVFAGGAGDSLGTTPFTRSFDRAPRVQSFEFRLDGHELVTREVSLDVTGAVEVELSAMATDVAETPEPQRMRPRAEAPRPDQTVRAEKASKPAPSPAPEATQPPPEEPKKPTEYDKGGVIDPFD